ncbi:MAG: YncE family protein [Maribacter sp.]
MRRKARLIMKLSRNTRIVILLFFILIMAISCCKEEIVMKDSMEESFNENTVFGRWKITGGYFTTADDAYVIFNDDNSIDILSEDNLGFRRIRSFLKVASNNKIVSTSRFVRQANYEYTLDNRTLTLIDTETSSVISLERNSESPSTNNWIETLSVAVQLDAPYNLNVDIGHDGTNILFANGRTNTAIARINTTTLDTSTPWETSIQTLAIETEKAGEGSQSLLFLGLIDRPKFTAKENIADASVFDSNDLGTMATIGLSGPAIRGIASAGNKKVWVANANTRELFLYDYISGTIVQTIPLNVTPLGLDFQAGYLYVTDGNYLHKCQTEDNFKVIKSYKIPKHTISGIAYDGYNFWANTDAVDSSITILGGIQGNANSLQKLNLSK